MTRAEHIKQKILEQHGVYKGGLELEEEEVIQIGKGTETSFIHEFAGVEIKIRAENPKMYSKTLNKNKDSIKLNKEQTIFRYPPWESYTTKQSKRGVIIGTIYRIEQ